MESVSLDSYHHERTWIPLRSESQNINHSLTLCCVSLGYHGFSSIELCIYNPAHQFGWFYLFTTLPCPIGPSSYFFYIDIGYSAYRGHAPSDHLLLRPTSLVITPFQTEPSKLLILLMLFSQSHPFIRFSPRGSDEMDDTVCALVSAWDVRVVVMVNWFVLWGFIFLSLGMHWLVCL